MPRPISRRVSMLVPALACLLGVSGASANAVTGKAAKHAGKHGRTHSAPPGVVLGGIVQGMPGAIEISRDATQIVQMALTVSLKCQPNGESIVLPDSFAHVPIGADGSFHETVTHSDSESELNSSVTGKFNRAMTEVKTTWRLTIAIHNGTVNGTCDSGPVNFTAIQ